MEMGAQNSSQNLLSEYFGALEQGAVETVVEVVVVFLDLPWR